MFTFIGEEFEQKMRDVLALEPQSEAILGGLIKMALSCTKYNPEERPTFNTILRDLEALHKSE